MKLLVGLGNPGAEYEMTRHNVGFMALDAIAGSFDTEIDERGGGSLIKLVNRDGEDYLLAKPQSYMNLSGRPVVALMKRFSLAPADISVFHDDLDIPLGSVKEKRSGGSAGHNGVSSIIEEVGTGEFRRLRIGIGRPEKGVDISEYVLSPFSRMEMEMVSRVLDECINLALNLN